MDDLSKGINLDQGPSRDEAAEQAIKVDWGKYFVEDGEYFHTERKIYWNQARDRGGNPVKMDLIVKYTKYDAFHKGAAVYLYDFDEKTGEVFFYSSWGGFYEHPTEGPLYLRYKDPFSETEHVMKLVQKI